MAYAKHAEPVWVPHRLVLSVPNEVPAEQAAYAALGREPSSFAAQDVYENGSVASLIYSAEGPPRMLKERIELFGGTVSAVIDDLRTAEVFQDQGANKGALGRTDKGQRRMVEAFDTALPSGGAPPMTPESSYAAMPATLTAKQSLESGRSVEVGPLAPRTVG